jgi:hypothetical protein
MLRDAPHKNGANLQIPANLPRIFPISLKRKTVLRAIT